MKKYFSNHRLAFILGLLFVSVVVSEGCYYRRVFKESNKGIAGCDAVLVYGGRYSRTVRGLALANQYHAALFVSDSFGGPEDILKKMGPSRVPITVDPLAMTTDQNARNAVQFIHKGGYRKVLLVTSWFHMPRALFLTRFYLPEAGVIIEPYCSDPIPGDWWIEPDFWGEMIRFWGSIGRVALASVGFEKAWFHFYVHLFD